MLKEKLLNYLKNYNTYFSSRIEDNERIFKNINKLLKFLDKKEILSSSKLLDLGSGDKSFYKVCLKNGVDAKEIDGASEGIDFEKDKLPYAENTFDYVYFCAVIEHLYDANPILSEIFRVLKKGGVLITITPNFTLCYKEFYNDPTHFHPYTPKSLKKILEMNQFKDNVINPFLINKSTNYWKIPYKFYIASILPFRNDSFQKFPIPIFFRGKSTSMISVSEK